MDEDEQLDKSKTGKFTREKVTSPFSGGLRDLTPMGGNVRIQIVRAKSGDKKPRAEKQ